MAKHVPKRNRKKKRNKFFNKSLLKRSDLSFSHIPNQLEKVKLSIFLTCSRSWFKSKDAGIFTYFKPSKDVLKVYAVEGLNLTQNRCIFMEPCCYEI
jgi:hypothetical protein